jgi:hypothetical protein
MADNQRRTAPDVAMRRSRGASWKPVAEVCGVVALIVICASMLILDTVLMRAMAGPLDMNDFGKFYYSARAFLEGRDMYAPSPATDMRFEQAPDLRLLNMNPPHFHLLVVPLAILDPNRAVALWMGLSLFALVVSVLIIGRELGMSWTPTRVLIAAAGILSFGGTQAFFVTGQLSMLLLLALTICWLNARHGRWRTAGLWLGICLSVKPFLLIFVPYLLGTRRYRALAVALAAAAACFAIGWLVFGVHAYLSWYGALSQSGDWAWTVMNASTFALFRRAFDLQPIVTPLLVKPQLVKLWMVVAGVIGILTVAVTIADTTRAAVDRAFALLLVAAQLISPLGWIYYVTLAAGPVAAVAIRPRTESRRLQWTGAGLAAAAAAGFAWPLPFMGAFQPHRWATLLIASAYGWATLALWAWLMLDYRRSRNEAGPADASAINARRTCTKDEG